MTFSNATNNPNICTQHMFNYLYSTIFHKH